MTHHLPPASQATACGVVGGWNDDGEGRQQERMGDREHYHHHCCELLCMGWAGWYKTSTCHHRCESLLTRWIVGPRQ
jgi:hypothetical protein